MVPSLSSDLEREAATGQLQWEPTEDLDGAELELDAAEDMAEPFDPTQIRVGLWSPTIDLLMTRVRENEISLVPDFQRQSGLWTDAAQSRLIESILIRIPLPAFYMDATDEDRYVVVDGNQRLTTLKRFVLDQSLRLEGLEFLTELHSKAYEDLSRQFKRRIAETQVTVYLIEKGSPESVKYNIFKRINTGGLLLSPQEIRHALNQGPVVCFLRELAESEEFMRATEGAVSGRRMADRECVLRFLAFTIRPYAQYRSGDLDGFLHEAMAAINRMSDTERNVLGRRFRRAMRAAHDIFGEFAFRKYGDASGRRGPVNKALLETWSVNLDVRTDDELTLLTRRREQMRTEFRGLLLTDRAFEASVSVGTSDPRKVAVRFRRIEELIDRVLG